MAVALLRLAVLFVIIDMFAVVTSFGLRAFKDSHFPFLVMTVAYWMVALPLGYYLGMSDPLSNLYGAVGFWWAMIAGVVIAAVLTGWKLNVWMNRPLVADVNYSVDTADACSA